MIFIWLSRMKEFDIFKFIKFLKAFNSIENIYKFSNNSFLFKSILIQNSLKISDSLFNEFTSKIFKEESVQIYRNLVNQDIKFITFFSKFYPVELKGTINAPLLLLVSGDLNILETERKKIYMYSSNIEYVKNNKYLYSLYRYIQENQNIVKVNINANKSIIINDDVDIFDKDFTLKNSDIKDNKLCFFIPRKSLYKEELICSLYDYLFILNSNFNIYMCEIVSLTLDFGKNILTIPGNISDKNCSFSNYLLRDGANVILNKKDLDFFINKN